MSSDSRWTGGLANREWQAGTRPEQQVDVDALTRQVKQYLRDCRTHRALLNPAYHPTEDGCLKIVYHRGHGQKQAIIAAYRELLDRAAMPGQRVNHGPACGCTPCKAEPSYEARRG